MTLLERDRLNFEEGVEEGIEKGKMLMAKKLLVKGMSIDEVVAISELTKEQVEAIYSTEVMKEQS